MFLSKKFSLLFSLVALALAPAASFAQLTSKPALNLEAARTIVAAAQEQADKLEVRVVIAVVDDGGHLIYLQRADGAPTGSNNVAIGKARTAAAFKLPTQILDEMSKTRPAILSISPDALLLEGGVPVLVDGQVVGAVGVSGASSQEDANIAEVGIAALLEL